MEVTLVDKIYKHPTRLGEPAKMISQRVIGQEDMDVRELDDVWAELILMGMQEAGYLPHTEEILSRTV